MLFFFKYLLPFLLNQCGSVLYVSNLGNSDLSLIVPVTNGLTFAFTAITGWISKEEKLPKSKFFFHLFILSYRIHQN